MKAIQPDMIGVINIALLERVSIEGQYIYEFELDDELEVDFLSPVFVKASGDREPIRVRAFLTSGKRLLVHSESRLPYIQAAHISVDPTLRWSNKQFVKSIYPGFSKWVKEEDVFWDDFCRLDFSLREFLKEALLPYNELCTATAREFKSVRGNCDNVNYNAEEVVLAYVILHFLDRYHRFQITWSHLLEKGLLPVRTLPIDVVDVGTGPAPSLFALSDIYVILQRYGKQESINRLGSLRFSTDYVEQSTEFREWLNSFLSFIGRSVEISATWVKYYGMSAGEYSPHTWSIPSEFGSFWDARELNFQALKEGLQREEINRIYNTTELDWPDVVATVQGWIDGWKNEFRYNVFTFSNFITQPEQVPELKSMLHSAYRSLRNGGLIVLVGGTGTKYKTIYREVKECLLGIAQKRPLIYQTILSYEYSDRYASALRNFLEFVLYEFEKRGVVNGIEKKTQEKLRAVLSNTKGRRKWGCVVFKK